MHPLLPFHIAAGGVALIAGFIGIAAAKGGKLHGQAGTLFFLSMVAMGLSGTIVALAMPERGTATIGLFTAYLVATSWRTARRRDGIPGMFERVGLGVALSCLAAFAIIFWLGVQEPDGRLDLLPAAVHLPFGVLAALAVATDLNFILRGKLSGTQRITRHLWRMSTALLIAAFSFFLGQQDNFPEALRGPFLFAPPLAVLASMLFWLVRIRFKKALATIMSRRRPRLAREPA